MSYDNSPSLESHKRNSIDHPFIKLDNKKLTLKVNNVVSRNGDSNIRVRTSNYYTSNVVRSNLTLKDTPKTHFEKVIETIRDIQTKFEMKGNKVLKNKSQIVINELLSNKMYRFEHKGEVDSEQHLFFSLYTTDYNTTYEKVVVLEGKSDEPSKGLLYATTEILNPSKRTVNLRKAVQISSFGVKFDVFSIADEIGKHNMFHSVANASFGYKDVYKILKTSYLDDFIEEIRKGYTSESEAFYHNVIILIISFRIFTLRMLCRE